MKKFLIVSMVVVLSSFIMGAGCLTPPNQAPIITSDPVETATVGETYIYDVDATDPDGDVLTYYLTVMPSHMNIGSANGLIIWTPPAKGDYDVTVKVSDGDLDIYQSFTIVVSVDEPEPEPEPELVLVGITVLPKKMTLFVGETEAIKSVTATYVLKGYELPIAFKDCLFLTSNSKIATVDKDGIVTAVKAGTATITASYKGKMDTLAITVSAVKLDHIVVLPEKITLEKYDFGFINSVTAHYSDETKDEIYLGDCDYKSSDTDVAAVDKYFSSIMIWALSAGTADITVSYTEGGITKTDIVEVIVSEPESPEPVEPPDKSETPVITSVPGADDGYVNEAEEAGITEVTGYSIDGSIIKLYLDDELIGTTIASKAKSVFAMFEFEDLEIDLGDDGEKTLYATAQEAGLAVSDPSDPYTFILDTTPPELETVSIDGSVFEDGDLVAFEADDTFDELTAEMSEPVSLVDPDVEPVITIGIPDNDVAFATFEISEDGLTLTLTPATAYLEIPLTEEEFYTYAAGVMQFNYEEGLVEDAAGNGIEAGSFTLTFVEVTP